MHRELEQNIEIIETNHFKKFEFCFTGGYSDAIKIKENFPEFYVNWTGHVGYTGTTYIIINKSLNLTKGEIISKLELLDIKEV